MSIKLKGSTDGSVTLQAPADTSPTGTDKTLTLPTTVGSANQFLQNGSTAGTLEFGSLVSGDMPTGSILQVVRALKTNQAQFSSGISLDVPDLAPSITPRSTSSKILVMTDVSISAASGGHRAGARVLRRVGSTETVLDQGDSSGNKTRTQWASHLTTLNGFMHRACILLLDSPNTTSQVTYKFQIQRIDAGTIQVNRGFNEADASSHGMPISSVVLMEVQG